MAPDLAQRLGDVLLREHPPTREPLQSGGQPFGEGRKHKPTKLLSELPESKWGDPNARHPFPTRPTRGGVDQPYDGYGAHQQRLDVPSPDHGAARTTFRPGALQRVGKAHSGRFVIPQRVPHQRIRPRPPFMAEHLVAVAVPPRGGEGGGAVITEVLLQQESNLAIAEPVLVAPRV